MASKVKLSPAELQSAVAKYETYINDVLKEELRVTDERLQVVNAEISEYIQQKHTIKIVNNKAIHPDGFKTQVDVGCAFFMEAKVTDTSTMLFNIGLNHYLELTLDEANEYIDVTVKALEEKASELRDKSSLTKAHIKMMLFGIGELQGINNNEECQR